MFFTFFDRFMFSKQKYGNDYLLHLCKKILNYKKVKVKKVLNKNL